MRIFFTHQLAAFVHIGVGQEKARAVAAFEAIKVELVERLIVLKDLLIGFDLDPAGGTRHDDSALITLNVEVLTLLERKFGQAILKARVADVALDAGFVENKPVGVLGALVRSPDLASANRARNLEVIPTKDLDLIEGVVVVSQHFEALLAL